MRYNQKNYNQIYHEGKNSHKSNIPLSVFAEIYSRLNKAFGENTVVIGGRAINLLCYNETRFTHDIDVVVPTNPSEYSERLIEEKFSIKRDGRKIVGATDMEDTSIEPLTLDFYYARPINGIEISEILKNVKEIDVADTKVLVPKPAIMLMLKYDAGRPKDVRDFDLLLGNFYGGKIESLFEKEKTLFDELLEKHKTDGKKLNKLLVKYYYYEQTKSQLRK